MIRSRIPNIIIGLGLGCSLALHNPLAAQDLAAPETVQAVPLTVYGILPDRLEAVPGSFDLVDREDLTARQPVSIRETLNEVPGINVVEEDTMGLGLNIGVRGLDPRRTSRTLLLEDGMPLFLAPYGDPAAHYSTPLERVERIEVVKGSGQILYGPQTVGGMINFVTRPVPTDGLHGSIAGSAGNQDYRNLYANIGWGSERAGFMIDALKKSGDGVRDNHDFDLRDIALKARLKLGANHELMAKLSSYEEDSQVSETALGLVEFEENKFQAPTGRQDRFEQECKTAQLRHLWQPSEKVKLSTQLYYVDNERASFRQINEPGGNAGRSQLERCPAGVNRNDLSNGPLCGGRWRPRAFEYHGVEPRLDIQHELFGVPSDAVIGLRYHTEDQLREQYRGNDPTFQDLAFARSAVAPREQIMIDYKAWSYYAQNTFYLGQWALTPGLRVESLDAETTVLRADGNAAPPGAGRGSTKDTLYLPGFGVAWYAIPNTTLFAGVHRGFAPPRPSRDLDGFDVATVSPETSRNWELGVRSRRQNGINFAATLFLTDFDDIVVSDGSGTFSNGGKSRQAGFELAGRIDFGTMFKTKHNVYLSGSYTHVSIAEFRVDGAADPDGGTVNRGDRLPYAPRHLLSLNLGYQNPVGLDARIGVDYRSEQQPDAFARGEDPLTGLSGSIPSYAVLNAAVNYKRPGSKLSLFLSGHNLADREYLASRVDGMVAGRRRLIFGGIRYDL